MRTVQCTTCGQTKIEGAEDGNPSPTIMRAVGWLAGVGKLLLEKNARYGDSAANPMRIFSRASSTEQVLVRIDDKLSRIARGAGLDATDEDTVRDLAGYLAIFAALRSKVSP